MRFLLELRIEVTKSWIKFKNLVRVPYFSGMAGVDPGGGGGGVSRGVYEPPHICP